MKRRFGLLLLALGLMACETQSGAIAEPCAAPAQAQTAACGNGLACSDACRLAVMHYRDCVFVTSHQLILGSPRHCLNAAAKAQNQ